MEHRAYTELGVQSDLDRVEQPDLNSPHSEDYFFLKFCLQLRMKSKTCSLSGCSRVNKKAVKHCKPTAWTCIQHRSLPRQQQHVVRKQRIRSTNARSTSFTKEVEVFENYAQGSTATVLRIPHSQQWSWTPVTSSASSQPAARHISYPCPVKNNTSPLSVFNFTR